jgi:hypothetical protein
MMTEFNRTDDRLTTADFAVRRAAEAGASQDLQSDPQSDPRLRAQRDAELRARETELTGGLVDDYPSPARQDDLRGAEAALPDRTSLPGRENSLANARPGLTADRGDAFRSGTVTDNAPGSAAHEFATHDKLRGDGMGGNSLLSDSDIGELRSRWSDIQAEFVDEPRRSVEKADELVASAMQRLAEGFANERASLEKQWDSGSNVSTEDLRIALQRYRAFFGRLINAA